MTQFPNLNVLQSTPPATVGKMLSVKETLSHFSQQGIMVHDLLLKDNRITGKKRVISEVPMVKSRGEVARLNHLFPAEQVGNMLRLSHLAIAVSQVPRGMSMFRAAREADPMDVSSEELIGCIREAEELTQTTQMHDKQLCVVMERPIGPKKLVGILGGVYINPPAEEAPPTPYLLIGDNQGGYGASPEDLISAKLYQLVKP